MTGFKRFRSPNVSAALNSGFTLRALIAFAVLLLLVFILATVMLVGIAHTQNDQARDQGLFFAEKALKIRQENLQRSISDYAFWGDAYLHLHAHVDLDWAYTRRNLGSSLFEDFGYEGLFVVAPNNRTVYAVIEGQLQPTLIENWLQGDIRALLDESRARVADEQSVVKVFQVDGQPALVVAASLTPGGDPTVKEVPGAPSVLLFVDVLSPNKLLRLGDDYALSQLRVARGAEETEGPRFSVPSADGTPIWLQWDPAEPGSPLFRLVLPLLGLAGLIIASLSGWVIRRAMATSQLLANNYSSLVASEARFHDIAQTSSDWLWETDAKQRISYLSERFEIITGHAREKWLGRPIGEFLSFARVSSLASWVDNPEVQATPYTPLSCSYQSATGEYSICNLVVCAIQGPDGLLGYRGTARDITAEVESQARIQKLQHYDSLTGLSNRKQLHEQLERLMSGMSDDPISVLSIGLQRFKQINDRFGRSVGDQVLVEVSQRLEGFLREEDFLARHTSDEFVVLLNGGFSSEEEIVDLCSRLIDCMTHPLGAVQQQTALNIRIGIARAPEDARTAAELLRYADIALYWARHHKNTPWCFFTREMEHHIVEEKQLESDLHKAIGNGELRLHFQPRYRTSDRHLSGVEALVRWQHPQRGLLSPSVFIPLAEQSGLICLLGTWVLREACFQARSFAAPIFVSVNLSPEQFRSSDLVAQVKRVLAESGLPANRLELEITEGMMFDDAEGALLTLEELKLLGVKLSMDDFGTGYSSLSYLRHYPFDILKIDRSFTAQLNNAEDGLAVVLAIVRLGHALSMQVTAEGVENEKQLTLLKEMGCDEVQGFHFSPPLPIERLGALLKKSLTA